ncbi:ribonuclease H [Candidatus Gracilibacteria bacterium]|nr:ribonuclease H [Candidatus Gracilibacteria bacterium]
MSIEYNKNSLCVDASCIGNPGVMEYRIFDISQNKVIWESEQYPKGTNNLGEFLALVEALKLPNLKKYDCIYSDSQTAIARVKTKKIKTTLKYSPQTKKLLEKIEEAKVWLKTHELNITILKWETEIWGEIPADYGRKG